MPATAASRHCAQWLERQIGQMKPGQFLPAVEAIAGMHALSARSVRRLITRMRDRGLVECIPGRGTRAPPGGDPVGRCSPAPPRSMSSAERLAQMYAGRIGEGALKIGQVLPSVKHASLTLRVSPATVTRAHRLLEQQGLCCRIGRVCRVGGSMPTDRSGGEVLLFNLSSSDFSELYDERGILGASFRKLEQELVANGLAITYLTRAAFEGRIRAMPEARARPFAIVCCNCAEASNAPYVQQIREMEGRLGRAALPVLFVGFNLTRQNRLFHQVDLGNLWTVRARTLARYIRDLGESAVTVFFEQTSWYPWMRFWSLAKIRIELRALVPAARFRYVVRPGMRSVRSTDDLGDAIFRRYDQGYIASFLSQRGPCAPEEFLEEVQVAESVEGVFAQEKPAGVWVFEKDRHAAAALDHCARVGRKPGRDVAIVSLENSPRYYHRGITACCEDWDTNGYLMAHALIGDIAYERTSRGFIRPRCQILERGTTRRTGGTPARGCMPEA